MSCLSGSGSIPSPSGSVMSDDEVTTTTNISAPSSTTTSPTSAANSISSSMSSAPIINSSSRLDNDPDKPPTPMLGSQNESGSQMDQFDRAFCVRMKSTLTKRGCHFKSAGYRVVLLLSRIRNQIAFGQHRKTNNISLGLVVLAIALPPPSVNEVRLETDMFVTRLNFDFRIAHCEPRVEELIEYTAEELTGRNMYTFCHAQDVKKIRKCHLDLMSKGQVISPYYRIMNKNGGFSWVQTCGTVIMNSKNSDEQSIICVNYVLSKVEYRNTVMDRVQITLDDLEENEVSTTKDEIVCDDPDNESIGGGNLVKSQNERIINKKSSTTPPIAAEFKETGQEISNSPNELIIEPRMSSKIVNDNQESTCNYEDLKQKKQKEVTIVQADMDKVTRSYSHRKRKLSGDVSTEITDSGSEVPDKGSKNRTMRCSTSPEKQRTKKGTNEGNSKTNSDSGCEKHESDQSPIWVESSTTSSQLSASALLRHIYANRESVIRSNFQRTTYYPDGSESMGDQSQFLLGQKMATASCNAGSTSPLPASPSSDKYQCLGSTDPASLHGHYAGSVDHPTYPMKHQLYVSSASTIGSLSDPLSAYQNSNNQQQYAGPPMDHHLQTQSGSPTASFYNAHHSAGFHLYHPGLNKVPIHTSPIAYIDGLKNPTTWYNQSGS